MAHICQVHPYEAAEGLCRSCGGPFCADCLVYPFGPVKPPYCVPCAVTAAGVRRSARNPTVAVPKETKQRLKEWRKARKRDLASPPPDGVGTWQRMDEADSAVDEAAAEAQAAAEREALRLPPPEPETPTPPAGVNLAPPGPAGSDWRDEIAAPTATGVGATGPRTDQYSGPADLEAFGIGADPAFNAPAEETGWAPPTERVPIADPPPVAAVAPTPPVPGAGEPFAASANEATPFASTPFAPSPFGSTPLEAGPFEVKPLDDAPFEATPFEATPFEPAAFEATLSEPTPFAPANATTSPVAFDLAPDPLSAFNVPAPTTTELLTSFGDDEGTFPRPDPTAFDPLPPPPPAAQHHSFDPLPEAEHDPFAPLLNAGPTAFDPLPPPPSAAQHHSFDALPQVEAPADAFPPSMYPPATTPPAPGLPDLAVIPRSAIRPPTPTRIPAGTGDGTRPTDAKAMLARIAALRTDQDD